MKTFEDIVRQTKMDHLDTIAHTLTEILQEVYKLENCRQKSIVVNMIESPLLLIEKIQLNYLNAFK